MRFFKIISFLITIIFIFNIITVPAYAVDTDTVITPANPPEFSGTISRSATYPAFITFMPANFTSYYKKNDGDDIEYISISGSNPSFGSLRLGNSYYSFGELISIDNISGLNFTSSQKEIDGTVSYIVKAYTGDSSQNAVEVKGSVILTITVNISEYYDDSDYYDSDSDTIYYKTGRGKEVFFDTRDFDDACYKQTKKSLSYVIFTLPSSSQGILYYISSTGYSERVTSGKRFYFDSAPDLNDVSFIPRSSYSGNATVNYRGYAVGGGSFTGKIRIAVSTEDETKPLTYYAKNGDVVNFNGGDFDDICRSMGYGRLDYIKFSSVPTVKTAGTLCFNYDPLSNKGTSVSANKLIYYNRNTTPNIDGITFIPSTSFMGAISIQYTGYDINGKSYTESVKIISQRTAETIKYITGLNQPVALSSAEINAVCKQTTGRDLSYVRFAAPYQYSGALRYNYKSEWEPGYAINYNFQQDNAENIYYSDLYYRNEEPFLSNITLVPYGNTTGMITISYSGVDTAGNNFLGDITVTVNSGSGATKYFDDVDYSYSWAAGQIDFLYDKGVVMGAGYRVYAPEENITRGDFVLMLHRALNFSVRGSDGFTDVSTDSYYYEAITTAKSLNIAQGDGKYFYPNSPLTRQDAMTFIYRALEAAKKPIAAGVAKDISGYTDKGLVASYAAVPAASLVKMGIIQGVNGTLKPQDSLSRAEMAVILFRIMI